MTQTTNELAGFAELFWDAQDPNNEGWTIRYTLVVLDGMNAEETCPLDGDEDARLDDLELAAQIALDGYTGSCRIYRGDQVARTFVLAGAPSDMERIAIDAGIEGRHADARTIRMEEA